MAKSPRKGYNHNPVSQKGLSSNDILNSTSSNAKKGIKGTTTTTVTKKAPKKTKPKSSSHSNMNIPERKTHGGKNLNSIIKNRSRRFSLVSSSSSLSDVSIEDNMDDDDDDDDENDEGVDGNGNSSGVDENENAIADSSDDEMNSEEERFLMASAQREMDNIISSGSENDDDSDSSSDDYDESDSDVDLVELTKAKRAKAMKALKAMKKPSKTTSKTTVTKTTTATTTDDNNTNEDQNENTDNINENDDDNNNNNDDDESEIDFEFNFDDSDSDMEDEKSKDKPIIKQQQQEQEQQKQEKLAVPMKPQISNTQTATSKPKSDLNDEDLGEEVIVESPSKNNTNSKLTTKGKSLITSTYNQSINNNKLVDINDDVDKIEVPKIDANDIDSEDDYNFNKEDLINTLQNDNNELELMAFGNSDDDFDFLLPADDPFFDDDEEEEVIEGEDEDDDDDDEGADTNNTNNDNEDEDEEDDFIMKEETEAMVDDFGSGMGILNGQFGASNTNSRFSNKKPSRFNRRTSSLIAKDLINKNLLPTFVPAPEDNDFNAIEEDGDDDYNLNDNDDDDNEQAIIDDEDEEMEAILNGDDDDNSSDFDIALYDDMFNNPSSYRNSSATATTTSDATLLPGGTGATTAPGVSGKIHKDKRRRKSRNAFKKDYDSEDEDEMKLLPYFFGSSDSENESNDNGSRRSSRAKSSGRLSKKNSIADTVDMILPDNGAETDEDVSVPKKVKKYAGSKIAKEVLSSSKNNFRAPVLGTFNTSKFKKPFGIIDGFSTRFLHPANERDGTSRSSILKGEHSSALSNISNITINSNNSLSHLRNSGNAMSQSPVALDEFINISEFEEDDDADVIESNKHWNPFKERSIPLSAFRNKGLINNYQIPDNSVNLRKYSNSNSMANSFGPTAGNDSNRRRSSFNHSGNKIRRGSKSIRRNSQSQSMSPGPSKQQHYQQKIPKQKQIQQSSAVTKRRNLVKHSAGDIDIEIPILDEELLGIASESALHLSSNKAAASITPVMKSTRRPSMSSSKKVRQQERVRRQSMVEAAAEGLRSTRGGLFSEETLTGVEALLVDIGSTDDFSFLFNEN
ncbi:hypothetical protein B5S30_g4719 [[Candida] boidinii]|nr:hypothetical protein B5S30_g4719 [[Candida] boidinii]